MADFNGGQLPARLHRSMPRLGDDLVLEIIARLPLKKAVQCTTLNKTFRRCISAPAFARLTAAASPTMTFHSSGKSPKLFTRLCVDIEYASVLPPTSEFDTGDSVTLDRPTSVMASSNGLILLHFMPTSLYYIFNPYTGGVIFVNYPVNGRLGLAVDFAGDFAHFKLVSMHVRRERRSSLLTFTVLKPAIRLATGDAKMALKSKVKFAAGRFPVKADEIQPVYADGWLYWLANGATTTVAFDMEREEPLIVSGPVSKHEDRVGDRWFGFADGSVRFIYAMEKEIVICVYDHRGREWGAQQRIPTLSSPSNNEYGKFGNGEPLFYDDGCLYFVVRKRGEDGHVYVYDSKTKKWELSWTVAGWTDAEQHFFQYTPSIAKVSNLHLIEQNYDLWSNAVFAECFRQLRKLMVPAPI